MENLRIFRTKTKMLLDGRQMDDGMEDGRKFWDGMEDGMEKISRMKDGKTSSIPSNALSVRSWSINSICSDAATEAAKLCHILCIQGNCNSNAFVVWMRFYLSEDVSDILSFLYNALSVEFLSLPRQPLDRFHFVWISQTWIYRRSWRSLRF